VLYTKQLIMTSFLNVNIPSEYVKISSRRDRTIDLGTAKLVMKRSTTISLLEVISEVTSSGTIVICPIYHDNYTATVRVCLSCTPGFYETGIDCLDRRLNSDIGLCNLTRQSVLPHRSNPGLNAVNISDLNYQPTASISTQDVIDKQRSFSSIIFGNEDDVLKISTTEFKPPNKDVVGVAFFTIRKLKNLLRRKID